MTAFLRFAALLLVLAAGPAMAAKRIALVIGNDDYAALPDLTRAAEDAEGYRAYLAEQGFEVEVLTNLPERQMRLALARFYDRIEPGDTVAFVYSGHGWSDGRENFLVPADLPAEMAAEEVRELSVPLRNGVSGVLDKLTGRGAALVVAVIDACRNNPFKPDPRLRSVGLARGLSPVEAPAGVVVVFSAGESQAALDRLHETDAARYSVFTRHFLAELRKGGYLQVAFKEAQRAVDREATVWGHSQQPALHDQVAGWVCLSGGSCSLTPAVAAVPAAPAPAAADANDRAARDWAVVAQAGSIEAYEIFVRTYPGTVYEPIARARIAALRAAVPAEVPQPEVPKPAVAPIDGLLADATPESLAKVGALKVEWMQGALAALGLFEGPADGKEGPATRAAVTRFQAFVGTEATGRLGDREKVALMKLAAEKGDAGSLRVLGLMYMVGFGVAPERAAAERHLRAAIARGSAEAQANLDALLRR